jgi:hypothetical protein
MSDAQLCPTCRAMEEVEAREDTLPLAYPDGSVSAALERAAEVLFTFDMDPSPISFGDLRESDRSFARETAHMVLKAWGVPADEI